MPTNENARPKTRLALHPTVVGLSRRAKSAPKQPLTIDDVRRIALAAGADDASAVALTHPDLAEEAPYVEAALPGARTLIAIVLRMHVDNVRSPERSIANLEFHRTGKAVDDVAHAIAKALGELGHRAINPAMAFPMEMDRFPERSWVVSHKRVAVAAGLGKMGLHRSVIHPRFGSFVLLGTIVTDAELADDAKPLDFDPCLRCQLCVAACPVGAIERDGSFRFSACYTHNYREFMSGFTDFVEEVADARDRHDFRSRVSQSESASMWQSLAFRPNYKAAYCLSVCPAGEDVIPPYLESRAEHVRTIVRPLLDRDEPVYVIAGSDAEEHVRKRFPHKRPRRVRSSLRPRSARHFIQALPLSFQRERARDLEARFHFDFAGADPIRATVVIDKGNLLIEDGLTGEPDLAVQCDGRLWIAILEKRESPLLSALTGKLRLRGKRALLMRFRACFPR